MALTVKILFKGFYPNKYNVTLHLRRLPRSVSVHAASQEELQEGLVLCAQ